VIDAGALPLLATVEALSRGGLRSGASGRNWSSYGASVDLPAGLDDWRRDLLCDPQTSGGLLVSVAPGAADAVLAFVRGQGFSLACRVGEIAAGDGRVRVR
jgi:selenide,water dikinase